MDPFKMELPPNMIHKHTNTQTHKHTNKQTHTQRHKDENRKTENASVSKTIKDKKKLFEKALR
mgnify:CR=1 FL=1